MRHGEREEATPPERYEDWMIAWLGNEGIGDDRMEIDMVVKHGYEGR